MTKRKREESRDERQLKMQQSQIQNIVNYAGKIGIEAIVKGYPMFQGSEQYLLKHVDREKLYDRASKIYSDLVQKNISGDRASKYIKEELIKYIQYENFLDEKGRKIILEKGLEQSPKGFLEKITSFFKPQSKSVRALGNTMEAFRDLYYFYKTGKYDVDLPDLDKSFKELRSSGFLYEAGRILNAYGVIDKATANSWGGKAYGKFKKHGGEIMHGLEKIAASILGLFGLGLLFFNLRFTGAVIDSSATVGINIIGMVIILASMVLFLRRKNI
jgi:hypothetical protein